jgi:hypothetical protein
MEMSMKKIVLQTVAVLGLVITGLSAAEANQVSFVQSSVDAMTGQSITFDLIGSGFSASAGPDGAGFSLSWDESVLQYMGTSVANPPWDTQFINAVSAGSGLIDFVFLGKSLGNAGSGFAIAAFTFNVIGNVGSSTHLTVADAFGGFANSGNGIAVNYTGSQVQVVPVPSAVWLFGTALLGLCNGGLRRRRSALVG